MYRMKPCGTKAVQDTYNELFNMFYQAVYVGWDNFPTTVYVGWDNFPTTEEVFKLEAGDDGEKVFAATNFFRNYRKTNKKSLFQLNLNFLDLKPKVCKHCSNVAKLVNHLAYQAGSIERLIYSDKFIWGSIFRPLRNSMSDADMQTFVDLKQKITENIQTIARELEI